MKRVVASMPPAVADDLHERRRVALQIEDAAERDSVLRAISAEEDQHLGSERTVEGKMFKYNEGRDTS